MKVLTISVDHDKWRRKKFQQEIEALARINDPNVVSITDVGETSDGQPFVVMEYIPGSTLRAVMDQRRMSLSEIGEIVRELASALTAAHDAGVCACQRLEKIQLALSDREKPWRRPRAGIPNQNRCARRATGAADRKYLAYLFNPT